MNKKHIALLSGALLAGAAGTATAQVQSAYTDADLVWKEDFNGKKLSGKDWNFEYHEQGWVNAELQRYGDAKQNTYVKEGCLVIQALKKTNKDGTVEYTSGRINTQGKYEFTYGRFEAQLAGWEIENKAGAAVTVTKDRARACAFCGRAVKAGRQGWRKAHVGKGGEAHGNARPLQATCRYRWRHEHRQAADVSAPAACFFMRRAGDSPPAVCL